MKKLWLPAIPALVSCAVVVVFLSIPPQEKTATAPAGAATGATPPSAGDAPRRSASEAPPAPPESPAPAAEAPSDPVTEILQQPDADFASLVNKLLDVLPKLDAGGQAEAAQHVANLSDEESARRWMAMLAANQLPATAAEVLFADLLNRPHEFIFPCLAEIADQPHHPLSARSREILEVLSPEPPPPGQSWKQWMGSRQREGSR